MTESVHRSVSSAEAPERLPELPGWVRELVQTLPSLVAYITLEPEIRVLYINPAGRAMLGHEQETAFGNGQSLDIRPTLDAAWFPEDAIVAVRRHEVWHDSVEIGSPGSGKVITLDRRVYPIAKEGHVLAACVIADDTSELVSGKRTSEVLAAVIDNVPSAVAIFAPNDKLEVLYANPASLEYNGVDSAAALQEKLRSHSSSQENIARFQTEIIPRVLKGERVQFESKIRNLRTGDSFAVQRVVFPVRQSGEEAISAIGSISTNIETINERAERAEWRLAQQDVLIDAVQNMYGGEKRRADYLEQIQVIASHAASQMNIAEMLNYVAMAVREAFGYYVVAIHVKDLETGQLVLKALDGNTGAAGLEEDSHSGISPHSSASWVATSGEELLITHSDSDPNEPLEGWPDTQSYLLLPITYSSRILGVLELHVNRPGQLNDLDRSAGRIIAGQIAVNLEIARLFEQTREQTLLEERNRIAREMHDSLIQKLASVHWQLSAFMMDSGSSGAPQPDLDKLTSISNVVQEALREARRSVWDLAAHEPDGRSLSEAIEQLVSRVSRESGIEGHFRSEGLDSVSVPATKSAILRISLEALNNIVAHSNAVNVDVTLKIHDSHLTLAIKDDGDGFDASELPEPTQESGYGLVSMSQRAKLINGELTITSSLGLGTEVVLTLPFEGDTKDAA